MNTLDVSITDPEFGERFLKEVAARTAQPYPQKEWNQKEDILWERVRVLVKASEDGAVDFWSFRDELNYILQERAAYADRRPAPGNL